MRKYKVFQTYTDYQGLRIQKNGEIMHWGEIQNLIGEKLLECNSAEQIDANTYEFHGKYQAAGGQLESFHYIIEFKLE